MNYQVVEKFVSIDGEGPASGELAVFIRFFGCDLRCLWCDTKYALTDQAQVSMMSAGEIYDFILASGVCNVTLTGGEPLIQAGIGDLLDFLAHDERLVIRVETHGGVEIAPLKRRFARLGVRLQFIVDFKLPTSQMTSRMCEANLRAVTNADTYKFVIASAEDLQLAIALVKREALTSRCWVYFSPVTELFAPHKIVEAMVCESLNQVRLQLQLHKYIWPKDMRGV